MKVKGIKACARLTKSPSVAGSCLDFSWPPCPRPLPTRRQHRNCATTVAMCCRPWIDISRKSRIPRSFTRWPRRRGVEVSRRYLNHHHDFAQRRLVPAYCWQVLAERGHHGQGSKTVIPVADRKRREREKFSLLSLIVNQIKL